MKANSNDRRTNTVEYRVVIDSVLVLLLLVWEFTLCATLGRLLCRAVCKFRVFPEIGFLFGYAAASLIGLLAIAITGTAKAILPAILLLLAAFAYRQSRFPVTELPEFLVRYGKFRTSLAGRIAMATILGFCLLVGSYRLPALLHRTDGSGVAIGSNVYPDEMRTLGIPISLAAHGYPLRFPIATDTVDVYPPAPFILSAGHIAWLPHFPLHVLIADSMAQTAIYGTAALFAGGICVSSPLLGLLIVLSGMVSVSYNLWGIELDRESPLFLKFFGYYKVNRLYTTIAWQPFGAFVWIMNHLLAFSAILTAGLWLAARRDEARKASVWAPALLLGIFAFASSVDVCLMSSVAIAGILLIELLRTRFRPRTSSWLLPAAGIFVSSGIAGGLILLPILLQRTDPPFFDPFQPIWGTRFFNIGVLGCTLGAYFVLLFAAAILSRFRLGIPWIWWVPLIVGLAFSMNFAFHATWLWRFCMAAHLLMGILCGIAVARLPNHARYVLIAAWIFFLFKGSQETRVVWLQGWNGASRKSPAVAEALHWIQTNTPLASRVVEVRETDGGLWSDVNFLRTGNAAGSSVSDAYHPQIGYRSYHERLKDFSNGLAANDYVLMSTASPVRYVMTDCGAAKDFSNASTAVYRITEPCRTALASTALRTEVAAAVEQSRVAAAAATGQAEKNHDRLLQTDVLQHPEKIMLLRNHLEKEFWPKGRYREAAKLLEPVVQAHPDVAEAHYSLAYTLHAGKIDVPQAVRHYDAALASGYSEFWVRYNRGSAHSDLRQFDKARADLHRARQLEPNHPDVKKLIDSLPK